MPEEKFSSAGTHLVSYVLGELDAQSQVALEKKIDDDPTLRDELDEVRAHVRLHQEVRKVAPRRGSFERLRLRMKKDGAFDGAIPGVHCMLRRSFVLAMIVGAIAIALLAAFSPSIGGGDPPNVIGEIVFTDPRPSVGQRVDVRERRKLEIREEPYDTDAYEAFLWLPTGVSNTYSSIEAAQNTAFNFTATRRMRLSTGTLRRMQIQPGGVGEGPFIVETPHCRVEVDEGGLTVSVTADGAETHISVGHGSARVFGLDAESGIPVTAGYCTSVERGKLPRPARPVLKLTLSTSGNAEYRVEATLLNDGYEPVTIRRAINQSRPEEPIYVLRITYTSEYSPEGVAEGVTLAPMKVVPIDADTEHMGEQRLNPNEPYRFTFDVGPVLRNSPRVAHWLQLDYRGDLYGPPGEARVNISSNNLKLDLRNR